MKKKIADLSEEEFKARNEKMKALQPDEKTPFIFVPAECPICGKESTQRYFKSDAYDVGKKALDLRPLSYTFKDKAFEVFHPPLFYVWMCPHCRFAAEAKCFEDPVAEIVSSMNNFRKRWLENYSNDEKFKKMITILGTLEEGEQVYYQAIKEYLLAIYQFESIVAVRERDALTLARLGLHLAWLYQDLEESSQRSSTKLLVDQLKYSIIHDWEDAPFDTESALKFALKYYDVTFFASKFLVEKKIDHQILQVIGRLNVILGNIPEGRKVFLKSIMVANAYKQEINEKLKSPNITKDMQEDLLPKGYKLDGFVVESQDLLYESKMMLKNEAE